MRLTSIILIGVLTGQTPDKHEALPALFQDWREFENPPLLNGAPDYTERQFRKRHRSFRALKKRLAAIDTAGWSASKKVDWQIVEAEMNGYDFNRRILKSWERDPAFYQTVWMYQSDVPAHEGPTNHALLEYWQYTFPLTGEAKEKFLRALELIPFLLQQAEENLTGNARDLWVAGINDIRDQGKNLKTIEEQLRKHHNNNTDNKLLISVEKAQTANSAFVNWLGKKAPDKNGPSGIGKDNYTWYQNKVHRVPLTWEEEVQLLQRELDRAWSSLKLEEERNKNLAPMKSADTPEQFAELIEEGVQRMMHFLKENDIMVI